MPNGSMGGSKAGGPLYQEIMLQINERLYIQGLIPKTLWEQAKVKIVEMTQ